MDELLTRVEELFEKAHPKAENIELTGLSHGDLAQIYVALQVATWHNQVSEEVLLKTIKKRKALNSK